MSQEHPTPREQAEIIVVNAMKKAETLYNEAIGQEKGKESRLDLLDDYATVLVNMSTALKAVSTESPC